MNSLEKIHFGKLYSILDFTHAISTCNHILEERFRINWVYFWKFLNGPSKFEVGSNKISLLGQRKELLFLEMLVMNKVNFKKLLEQHFFVVVVEKQRVLCFIVWKVKSKIVSINLLVEIFFCVCVCVFLWNKKYIFSYTFDLCGWADVNSNSPILITINYVITIVCSCFVEKTNVVIIFKHKYIQIWRRENALFTYILLQNTKFDDTVSTIKDFQQ